MHAWHGHQRGEYPGKDGFVERRPDEADRRVVRLYITDQGRALISYYVPQAAARWRKAFDFVDSADEAVVRGFFIQMHHLSQLCERNAAYDDRDRAGQGQGITGGDVGDRDRGPAQDL